MNRFFALISFLFICNLGISQNNNALQFDKTTYEFGDIKESIGKVTAVFKFKNISKKPVIINNVYAACGCTTTKYTKDSVMPGKSGLIEAVYTTTNRPGSFDKYVIVYTNDTANKGIYLYLKGYVFKGEKIIEEKYPQQIGNLKFKVNHIAYNKMSNTEIKTDTLWMYNSSKKKMNIEFTQLPEWIKVKPNKLTLKSTFDDYFLITYDASKRKDWGLNFDRIILKTTDDSLSEKLIYVSSQIEEDFTKLSTEQLEKAPIASFAVKDYDFGDVKEGTNVFYRFELINTGKSDLMIRKITSSCGCTTSNIDKTLLKPDENCFVSASFNTGGRSGEQQKTITIVTNDPKNPTIILSLIGKITN